MVVLHGGRIRAESEGLSRGSTFIVEFPGAIDAPETLLDAAPAAGTSGHRGKSGPPLRLLLVEDHAASLRALTRMLQDDGHTVIAAASEREALAAAVVNTFDLVLSDLGLPDGSGLELMEKLRTTYGLRGVALSGYGMEEDILRSRAAGFAVHLVKPVAIDELRRVLVSLGRAT
jgi:CheY-like chemotaxis protein